MRTLAVVLSLLALVASLAACGDDTESGVTPPDGSVFTDDGTRFTVAPGDEFTIVLESNASTGYAWDLAADLDPAVVEAVGTRYVEPDTDLVGAPGREELTFLAVGDGSTFIQLWYVRSFDDPPEPAERAQFEVIVGTGVPAGADGPSDGDEPASTIPDDEDAIELSTLLATMPAGEVVVRGSLFDDGTGLVLCGALAESFPPQCPGESIEIANPDGVDADYTVDGGVRWTDRPVVLLGRLVDERLEVLGS